MKDSIKKGLGFGMTSAVITTLSLIVGLHSGTDLKYAVIGAILVIAFADSLADSLGIYMSEKSREGGTTKDAGSSMIVTFFTKFTFALTFLVPILIFNDLHIAIIIDLIYGFILLVTLSYRMARDKKEKPLKTIAFHVFLAVAVITGSHYIGNWVNSIFTK